MPRGSGRGSGGGGGGGRGRGQGMGRGMGRCRRQAPGMGIGGPRHNPGQATAPTPSALANSPSNPDLAQQQSVAIIDDEACTLCGLCESACPTKAITMGTLAAQITAGLCQGCGICVQECPAGAIKLI